jgi:hypothetical protein
MCFRACKAYRRRGAVFERINRSLTVAAQLGLQLRRIEQAVTVGMRRVILQEDCGSS